MPTRRTGASPGKTRARTKLAETRLATGATQLDVARACGLSLSTYTRLEHGFYGDEPPLRELVNVGIALTGDPLFFIRDYLAWHPFDARRPSPPDPDSLAPGTPPAQIATDQDHPIDKLTGPQRELLRRMIRRLEGRDNHQGYEVEPDVVGGRIEIVLRVADSKGRRRECTRFGASQADLDALIRAGLLGPRTVGITAAGAGYAAQRLTVR